MKTARQVLLERHTSVETDLDALRLQVLKTLPADRPPWWVTAWREIVLSARPAWSALAVLALVALGMQVGSRDTGPDVPAPTPRSEADVTAVREQRQRLWAELLETSGETSPPPPVERRSLPPPHRSQIPVNLWPV